MQKGFECFIEFLQLYGTSVFSSIYKLWTIHFLSMNLLYNKSLFLSAYNGCNTREYYGRGNFVLNLGSCFNPHLLVCTFFSKEGKRIGLKGWMEGIVILASLKDHFIIWRNYGATSKWLLCLVSLCSILP